MAAMATKFPDCTPGLMSHRLTVLRAYSEVEDPAWQLNDIAYRKKMAAMGQKMWSGMEYRYTRKSVEADPEGDQSPREKPKEQQVLPAQEG